MHTRWIYMASIFWTSYSRPLVEDSQWTERNEKGELIVPSSQVVHKLDGLKTSMETFKELRLMLNEYLMNQVGSKTGENYKYSGSTPSFDDSEEDLEEKRNFVLVATVDETDEHRFIVKKSESNDQKPKQQKQKKQRKHRQRKNQRRNPDQNEMMQQDDPNSYQNRHVQGLQITANIQQSQKQRQTSHQRRFSAGLKKHVNECPKLHGKSTQVLCPSRRRHGYRVCIPDTALCNGHSDCPNGEDEDPINCLFYKTTIHHFRLIVDAVVDLSDMVKRHENGHSTDEL